MRATNQTDHRALRQALATLAEAAVIPQAAAVLERTMQNLDRALHDAVLAEIPAFTASGNPEIIPGLDQHISDHIREIRRLFDGHGVGSFEFVRTHAHR